MPAIVAVEADSVQTWSRSDYARMTAGAVRLIQSLGQEPGTPIPALLATRPASIALLLAGALSGRPLAPLAPRMTFRELHACVSNLRGDVLLAEPEWADMAQALAEASDKRVVFIDGPVLADDGWSPTRIRRPPHS
ncbi:hypothetical protein [Aeromicrobium sp. UC242_57]|uniref:hypothetical protein n=1 Tax=Aeromicrobium sp. UC242_57 TaxID=3374624 RepID=UPI0037C125C4